MYSKIILPKKSENVHWTNKILTKVLSNPCSDRHKSCRWYNKWNVSYYLHASLLVAIVWVSQYFLLGNKQCYVLTWQDLVVPLTDAALTFWSNFLQVVRLIFWYIDFFHNDIRTRTWLSPIWNLTFEHAFVCLIVIRIQIWHFLLGLILQLTNVFFPTWLFSIVMKLYNMVWGLWNTNHIFILVIDAAKNQSKRMS